MSNIDDAEHLARLDRLLGNSAIAWHIALMLLAYVALLPVGVVLGKRRHRLHIPIQLVMLAVAAAAYYFGFHHHPATAHHSTKSFQQKALHVQLGIVMGWLLAAQLAVGVLRKGCKMYCVIDGPRIIQLLSCACSWLHSGLGWLHLPLIYVQLLLGVVKTSNICQGHATTDCWLYYSAGSLLWWLGVVRLLRSVAPRVFSRRWTRRYRFEAQLLVLAGAVWIGRGLYDWQQHWSWQWRLLGVTWLLGGVLTLVASRRSANASRWLRYLHRLPLYILCTTSGISLGTVLMRPTLSAAPHHWTSLTAASIVCLAAGVDVALSHTRRPAASYASVTDPRITASHGAIRSIVRLLVAGLYVLGAIYLLASPQDWQQLLHAHQVHSSLQAVLYSAITLTLAAFALSLAALLVPPPPTLSCPAATASIPMQSMGSVPI